MRRSTFRPIFFIFLLTFQFLLTLSSDNFLFTLFTINFHENSQCFLFIYYYKVFYIFNYNIFENRFDILFHSTFLAFYLDLGLSFYLVYDLYITE